MNSRHLIIAASAIAMVAGCAKVDSIKFEAPDQLISFEPANAIATKALGEGQSSFPTAQTFKSFAWYLEPGKTWANSEHRPSAQPYISDQTIKFDDNYWRAYDELNTKFVDYYWPKGGSLTFFSYYPSSVTVTPTFKGIQAVDFVASNVKESNVDFMVADVIQDQRSNESSDILERDGVRTLFRHKLTQVSFSVKTNANYAPSEIYLNEIKIENAMGKATYESALPSSETLAQEVWTKCSTPTTYTFVTGAPTQLTPTDPAITQYFNLIPQYFSPDSNAAITLTFTLKLKGNNGNDINDVYTVSKKLNTIEEYGADAEDITNHKRWNVNKKVVYNITVGLDGIRWDPAVYDWNSQEHTIDVSTPPVPESEP